MPSSVSLKIVLAADPLVKESLCSPVGYWYPQIIEDRIFTATGAANLSASTGETAQPLHWENIAVKFQMLVVICREYSSKLVSYSVLLYNSKCVPVY